jgi:hypothetical protein
METETEVVHVVMVWDGDYRYPLMVWTDPAPAHDQAREEDGEVIEVPMMRNGRRRARARRIPA